MFKKKYKRKTYGRVFIKINLQNNCLEKKYKKYLSSGRRLRVQTIKITIVIK